MKLWQKLSQRQKETRAGYLFIMPWLVGFGLFIAWSMGYSLILSFQKADFLTPPVFIGLKNYRDLFANFLFWKSLKNTFYFVFVSVPLQLGLALVFALLLSEKLKKVRGSNVFRTIFYLPWVVPPAVGAIIWLWIYEPNFGLLNYILEKMRLGHP